MREKIESAAGKIEQMIQDAINCIDSKDDVCLANAIIQVNKNAPFPGYGMAVTLGLLAKRDAAIRKAAMEEATLYGPALAGWIPVLGARRDEPGYTDEYCANEAARLAVYTARAVLGWAEKETI